MPIDFNRHTITMTIVQRHIQYLAVTTDCVIIPGWGGLIACPIAAYVADGQFMPPSRSLLFNPSLTHDDGALASSLSRREHMSYEAARAEIAAEVAAMRAAYAAGGYLTLPRIGTFRRLADSTMQFEADPTGVAAARYSYLPPISLRDPETEAMPSAPALLPRRESLAKRVLRVAAFLAILLGLALTLSTPIPVNPGRHADFAAVGGTSAPLHGPAVTADAAIGHTLLICIPDSASAIAPVAPRPARETVTAGPQYYLVIGSLENRAKAERWMARHADRAIGIVESKGRYRVYAATGATIEEASRLKADSDFSRRHPDAWVCRQ